MYVDPSIIVNPRHTAMLKVTIQILDLHGNIEKIRQTTFPEVGIIRTVIVSLPSGGSAPYFPADRTM